MVFVAILSRCGTLWFWLFLLWVRWHVGVLYISITRRAAVFVLWTAFCLDLRWARSDNTGPFLEQGWEESDRQDYYHLSQGSQLVPYKWIQALEQPQGEAPFLADEVIKKYGYANKDKR